jgi:hypothetical protein
VTCVPKKVVPLKKSLFITAKSPKSVSIHIRRGTRLLATIDGDEGQAEIPAETLGLGPVQLQIIGTGEGGLSSNVVALLDVVVEE